MSYIRSCQSWAHHNKCLFQSQVCFIEACEREINGSATKFSVGCLYSRAAKMSPSANLFRRSLTTGWSSAHWSWPMMTSDLTDLTSNVKLLEFPLKGHHGVSVSLRTCPPPGSLRLRCSFQQLWTASCLGRRKQRSRLRRSSTDGTNSLSFTPLWKSYWSSGQISERLHWLGIILWNVCTTIVVSLS